jgi:hypothetical protein
LLIGRWNNRISQWNNTSTDNSLTFNFISDNFKNLAGSIGQNISLSIADFDQNGQLDLLAGSSNNKLRLYYNFLITPVLNADTTLFKSSLNGNIGAEKFGSFWNIAAADLNQDLFPDLAIGQKTGGLTFRQNTTAITLATQSNTSEKAIWTVYPNPANEFLDISEISDNETITVEVYNALGQVQLSKIVKSQEPRLYIRALANGLYAIKLSNGRRSFTKKILVQH